MRKLIKLILNDEIVDEFNNMLAISNGTAEIYINSDHIQQFSFSDYTVTFFLAGMTNGGFFRVKFSDKYINEYHRVKREFEEAFGRSIDENENLDEQKDDKYLKIQRELEKIYSDDD